MVTHLRVLKLCKMLLKLILLIESSSVNTMQTRLVGIASPISHRRRKQLVCLHSLSTHQMWSCTQIHKATLIIERDLSIFRKILNELYLVRLTLLLHELDCIVS